MNGLRRDTFDAIVVGSGPGGASVAGELCHAGWKTLLLEKGPDEPPRGALVQFARLAMIPGRSFHFTQELIGLAHGIAVGGSSLFYYATAVEPPYEMFDRYGIDLRGEVAELARELPIAPLADRLIGPAAGRIMASAQACGYPWRKLDKLVNQERCRPYCDKCTLGCPYGAKWTSRVLLHDDGQVGPTLIAGANVTRVLQENGRATGVEFICRGERRQAYAGTVVIAAGGIGTPAILRGSGIGEAGVDFFFDPLVIVIGEVADLRGGKEFPMAAGCDFPTDGYMLSDLVLPRPLFWLFTAQVLRFDRLPAHARCLPIMVKIRDELGGRLSPRGAVRKRLGSVEKQRLQHGSEVAREILLNAGARNIYKTWYLAVHPGGTAKIGQVVDANLATAVQGLYVCDCAVIPEAWGMPPALTLLALGKRLARHLAS